VQLNSSVVPINGQTEHSTVMEVCFDANCTQSSYANIMPTITTL